MEKVVCDICGTAFPENAENCPVCGCSRDFLMEDIGDALLMDEAAERSVRKKSREIFDFDEVNQERANGRSYDDDDEEDYDEEEEYEEAPRTNVALVVILVILIVLLLLAAGFFYLRFILPNMPDAEETEAIITTEAVETEAVPETESSVIPCTDLMIDGGRLELKEGGMKLLNVHVYPEDTTDAVTYVSADESVATVSEDGTVSAVGEGTTVITITCGQQKIDCNVTVDYDAAEETAADGTIPPIEVSSTDGETSADPTEETQAADETKPEETTSAEETNPTEETTGETTPSGSELKLKKNDITIFSNRTSVTLEMDCDIDPKDVDWFTMDSTIAIVHDGVVTSTGSGLTRIYGGYKGQQVECIVRCMF